MIEGFFYGLVSAILWGVSYYCFGKLAEKNFSIFDIKTFTLPFEFFFIVLAFYLGSPLTKIKSFLLSSQWYLIWIYLVSTLLAMFTIVKAIQKTNILIATIFEISYPIFIFFIMVWAGEDKFSLTKILGIILCILGILILMKEKG